MCATGTKLRILYLLTHQSLHRLLKYMIFLFWKIRSALCKVNHDVCQLISEPSTKECKFLVIKRFQMYPGMMYLKLLLVYV